MSCGIDKLSINPPPATGHKTVKNMKRITKWMTAILLVSLFNGCGPSAEEVLKKYEPYAQLTMESDKLPVSFEIIAKAPMISYSSPLISGSQEHVNALAGRWFVANALNPEVRLPAKMILMSVTEMTVADTMQSVSYGYNLAIDSIETPFLLVGFEGIAPAESKEAAIPPLFFLVENRKGKPSMLTPVPRAAGDLFTTAYTPMFFSEQTYSGEVPFENAKNVRLEMTLSPDLKQVIHLNLSAERLKMNPSEKGMSNLVFQGGFETKDSIGVIGGKITQTRQPLICDLTVTKACIFGQVKFELDMGSTKSVYAVFKNITTPQNIPEEILKKQ